MTKEELDKMTPEEKRVRIAEICGWTGTLCDEGTAWGMAPETMVILRSVAEHPFKCLFELPDYLDDLNAMHEAENILSREHQELYEHELSQAIPQNYNCGPGPDGLDIMVHSQFDLLHATASQRADAFLLILG